MSWFAKAVTVFAGLAVLLPASARADFREVTRDGTKSVSVSLNGLVNPAINTFWLRFTNGDHELRKIELKAWAGSAIATLADQNGDDPIRVDARFRSTTMLLLRTQTAKCRGACTITIDRPAAGLHKDVVLTGFALERLDGDSNVRKIAIRPTADKFAYVVEYVDNGTFDYNVTLRYAWITGTWSRDVVGGSRGTHDRSQQVEMDASRDDVDSVLQGFSVEFLDGDHHLKDFAIQQGPDRQYSVRFNDNNFDDRMTATLDVVYLRV